MEPVTIIGCRMGQDNADIREFLTRTAKPYEWFDADTEPAKELLAVAGSTDEALPVVIGQNFDTIENASVEKLAKAWGLRKYPSELVYDVAIIGAGPAGLAAAVYAASDGLKTVVFDQDIPGGQASHTSMIENFFGFPQGIGGAELTGLAVEQAEGFGAEIIQFSEINRVQHYVEGSLESPAGVIAEGFEIFVAGAGDGGGYGPVSARQLIAATGMEWRTLEAPGIAELLGHGVYYGAGRAEAAQCRGDSVIVVGAGNSAGQAAMYLANSGAKVTMLIRGDSLTKSMSSYLSHRIVQHTGIDTRFQCEVKEAVAKNGRLHTVIDSFDQPLPASAMFLCLGGQPRTGWAQNLGAQCTKGFIRTGPDLQGPDGTCAVRPEGWPLDRGPLSLETNVPNFYAIGDVRYGSSRRVGGAVGEGAAGVAELHRAVSEE